MNGAAWRALAAIPAACAVWAVIFAWQPLNFWVLMTAGVGGLGAAAVWIRGPFPLSEGARGSDILLGAAASACLYGIFAAGRVAVGYVLPSAHSQIDSVYAVRSLAPPWVIVLLLVCVIAPGEEIFWRGLVQWGLVRRLGPMRGWVAAALTYGFVHAASANVMLVIAATAAGAFWGWLYLRLGRIAPVVVSHIFWDLVVFVIAPLR